MALATPPLLQQKVFAIASRKRFVEVRVFGLTVLLEIKFNPDWSEAKVAGTAMTAASVEVDATNIILDVNGVLDRNVAHGGSVQSLLDAINATQADGTNRWRAGLGDVSPSVVLDPPTLGEEPAAFGYLGSVAVFAPATAFHIGVGTDRSNRGEGYFLPDGFNTNYDYPLDPENNPGQVGRSGGIDADQGEDFLPQRRSAFRNSPAALARERSSAATRFVTTVDSILADGLVSGIATIATYSISEIDGTVIWETDVAIATQSIVVPHVECRGPAFLTVVGDTGVAFTAGTVTMQGDIRVA